MEQFRNTSLIFLSLVLCFGFTDGAITAWDIDSTVTNAADATGSKSIAETSDATAVLLTVTATTGATLTGYSIGAEPTAGQFEVSSNGELSLAAGQVLDYEAATSITVEIEAADSAPSTGTAVITITVTNVNDNTPIITPVSIILDNGTAANTQVFAVCATDLDTADTITFALDPLIADFSIDTNTGKITVANELNMATTSSYNLVVKAADNGSPANTGSATVSVSVCTDFVCCTENAENGVVSASASIMLLISASLLPFC